jgi:hypothetical protein
MSTKPRRSPSSLLAVNIHYRLHRLPVRTACRVSCAARSPQCAVSTAATSPAVPCRNPPLGPGPCSARTDDPPHTRAECQTTFFRLRGGARCTGPAAAGPASPGSSGIDDRSRGPLRPDRRPCAPVVLRPIWPCAARPAESAVCAPFSYAPSAPAKCRRCTVPGFKCLQCSRSAPHTPPHLAFRRGVACMHPRHARRRVPTLRPVHLAREPTAAPNNSPPNPLPRAAPRGEHTACTRSAPVPRACRRRARRTCPRASSSHRVQQKGTRHPPSPASNAPSVGPISWSTTNAQSSYRSCARDTMLARRRPRHVARCGGQKSAAAHSSSDDSDSARRRNALRRTC